MKVFCPNCGSENEGVSGGHVTCRACTATFEVPAERDLAPAPPTTPTASPPRYRNPPLQVGTPIVAPSSIRPSVNVPTNTLAIVSIASSLVCCVPVGLVTGIIGLIQINNSGNTQKGKELAIIGIVLSGLGLSSSVLYAIAIALFNS